MVATKKMMSPQDFLKELRQIGVDIKPEELTPEGRLALLEQVMEIEKLILEMKKQFVTESVPNTTSA